MGDRISGLIGKEASFPVEHRILNIILLLGLGLSTASCLFFALFPLGRVPLAVSAVSSLIIAGLYYLSIKRKKYTLVATSLIAVFCFGIVPLTWFFMGGIAGGTPFYALIYAALITTLLRGRTRAAALGGFLIMLAALTVCQYVNPAVVRNPYDSDLQRYLDIFFAMLVAMAAIITFFVVILSYYIKEHQRSRDYLSQLEKHKMEIELARLDRLNLIGEMAASIGHEVRNPLTTVRGFLQLFQQQDDFDRYRERFGIMIGELDRANQIITEFLSLAKNKAIHLKQDNLNRIIGNLLLLLEADALLQGKLLISELGSVPDLPLDENEIRQCIINIVRNGFEATGDDGRVILKTFTDDQAVVLSIQDNGQGIAPEVYAKIGTPFVTTKPQGTGLGLPVCYRIAERHNAKIAVETGPGGTTFYLRFAKPHQP